MPVSGIHTFLVYPRTQEVAEIGGADVPLGGKLFDMLNGVYEKSELQCNIDISFNIGVAGVQQNDVRDLVLAYVSAPSLITGSPIARKLQSATDGRSGLGLLFLINGQEGLDRKLVISRFPADNGILAEMGRGGLSVEFLERVFMKSAHSYKAAAFRDASLRTGFWKGRAVDRQLNDPAVGLSGYWIKAFLDSDFHTTSAAGTRRLAAALKAAVKLTPDSQAKHAITAAAALAVGMNGQSITLNEFQDRFALPQPARDAISQSLKSPVALNERFVFDVDEFSRQISFRTVQLNTGVMLTAASTEFDQVFEIEELGDGRTRFSTEGIIVGETLRRKATA
ncbi:hypothetical protein [Phenylobacterium sp.]|uniref:hypothetical protein n=1 Tax=Phenylobacterium sp. TaxID=1871053 RepID=UPI002FC58A18